MLGAPRLGRTVDLEQHRQRLLKSIIFFFNDTATTEIYTLSLHDALPISRAAQPATTANRSSTTERPTSPGAPILWRWSVKPPIAASAGRNEQQIQKDSERRTACPASLR